MHWQTPLLKAPGTRPGRADLWLKMECWQPTGSFKIRGIGHLCRHLADQGAQRLVSSSGGNAGLATAYAGAQLGVSVTVIVPQTTSADVQARLTSLGAEVRVHGAIWDDADILARELSEQPGSAYASPFDHSAIWDGHASMIAECVDQQVKPDAVVLSVGGGGLMCGVLQGMHEAGWQDVPLIAAETRGAASLRACIDQKQWAKIDAIDSIASSLGAKQVAEQACNWLSRHPVHSCLVDDSEAVQACLTFADQRCTLVEPACGAALAAAERVAPQYQNLLVIVCGGVGANLDKLSQWKTQFGLTH